MGHFLEMKGITKSFGENVVLNEVDFHVDSGQVHALIGENGAGKSSLMKMLAGLYAPDKGEILLDGVPVAVQNTKHSQELGISMIYQEVRLFQDLSITQNVFMRREPVKHWMPLIDWDKANQETRRYLDYFGLDINTRMLVKSLSLGQQKFVEIIKALSQSSKILILDEPTAALTEVEIDVLFKVIRDVKKLGVSVIYISHRIEEIQKIADLVTVLKDGEVVRSTPVDQLDMKDIIRAMIGKELDDRYPKIKAKIGKEILRVEDLEYNGEIKKVSFNVKKGEIIGLTGLSGSGRRTLAKLLFGIYGPYRGRIHLNGKTFESITPHKAKRNGLCYVTGIHTEEGLLSNVRIAENITLTNLERVSKMGFLDRAAENRLAKDFVERLEITASEDEVVSNLSGGKQKKVIFAKWLFAGAQVLMIEEPTAGIDIGSKSDIYNIMNELVLSGASIIMISSDLSEIIGMCDRILVMCDGELRQILSKNEATQEKILYYASGGR